MKTYLYSVSVHLKGRKRGFLKEENLPEIEFSAPPEFGGEEGVWTPEHLFVSSICSCFFMTFVSVAEVMKLEIKDLKCVAQGKLEEKEGFKKEFVEIILKPFVTIPSETLKNKVLRAIKIAEENCLVARSIKAELKVEHEILVRDGS